MLLRRQRKFGDPRWNVRPWSYARLGFPLLPVLVTACESDDDPCAPTRAAEPKVDTCVRGGFAVDPPVAFGSGSCSSIEVCVAACVNRTSDCAFLYCGGGSDPNAPPWPAGHVDYCRCVLTCTGDLHEHPEAGSAM